MNYMVEYRAYCKQDTVYVKADDFIIKAWQSVPNAKNTVRNINKVYECGFMSPKSAIETASLHITKAIDNIR